MIADLLLSRLERVRQTGSNRWSACCPAHNDRSPSLSIKETPDGAILIHCFAGCATEAVINGIGLTFDDLYPKTDKTHFRRGRREQLISANQGLSIVASETLVAAVIASDIAKGKTVTNDEIDRLWLAVGRINTVYKEVSL